MKSTYYWLSTDVAIIRLDDGNVLFKSDTLAIKIETASVSLLIEKIFPLLDGLTDMQAVAQKLEVPPEMLEPHLLTLYEKGILKRSHEPLKPQSGFDKFLSNISVSPEMAGAVADHTVVAVFGLEGEGILIARSLLSAGIKRLVLVDTFLPDAENALIMDEYKNNNGESRQEIIRKLLQAQYPDTHISTPVTELTKEETARAISLSQLVICCFDNHFSAAAYWINAAAMEQKKPVIYSGIEAHKCMVGPMVIPGQTACYMCYKMRLLSNAEDFEMAMTTEKHYNKGTRPGMKDKAFLHPAINYNSSIITTEVLKYVFEIGPPSLASRMMEYNLLTQTASTHHVLEVPECKVCKKKTTRQHPGSKQLKHAAAYPSDIAQYGPLLLSPKTGAIRILEHYPKDISEPVKPLIYRADLANHRFVKKKDLSDNTCSGKGFTEAKAKISAMGEAVERYSGACYSNEEILLATYEQLQENKLNPEELVLFAAEQYKELPYKPYTHQSVLGWVNAWSLKDDRPVYVPAMSVYMNYELNTPDEHIFQITSNGLAAGSTMLGAILSAALEVIERDAFIIAWHNKFPCRRIDPLTVPGDEQLKEFIHAYKRRGVELYLFALPTDFPCHTFMAMGIQRDGDGPFAVTGLGADFDAAAAARSALMEVGQVRPALKKRLRLKEVQDKLAELLSDPSKVKELNDHDLLYASKASEGALAFLLEREVEAYHWDEPALTIGEKLDKLTEHVRSIGSDLIYYDLTPQDMRRLGLYTCRAIIPHTQPIHFGYENIRLGGRRLYEQCVRLGFAAAPKTAIDLYPHPLA